MKFLSVPWRWEFISKLAKKKGCVFCNALKAKSQDSLICYEGNNYFIILNKYPYSTGHLMIVPYQHVNSPDKIKPEDTIEMWRLMNEAIQILKNSFNPDGFNIGMNIGRAAGAGIENHCHLHIVPRWQGDSNFMATTADTKILSYEIADICETLKREFKKNNLKK